MGKNQDLLLNISKDLKQKPTKSKTKFPELSFLKIKILSEKKVFFCQKQSFFVKQRNVTLS